MWRFIVQSNLLMFYFFWPVSIIGQNDNQNVLLGSDRGDEVINGADVLSDKDQGETLENDADFDELTWDESLDSIGESDLLSILEEVSEEDDSAAFFSLNETSILFGSLVGRKSNVLYASNPVAEDRSLFGVHGEFLYWGLNYTGHRMTFYNYFEHLGFLAQGQADKEQIAISSFNYELPVYKEHKVIFDFGYLYQDQVFDVSSSEDSLFTVQAMGHQFSSSLGWKKKFDSNLTLQLSAAAERQVFAFPLDDYWQWGPVFEANWETDSRHELTFQSRFQNRDYDTRNETITGVPLRFKRLDSVLEWEYDIDEDGHWWTGVELGYRRNEDNGGGFFDYHRYSIGPTLGYEDDLWNVEVSYSYRKYFYELQFFGTESLIRDDSLLTFRIKYHVNDNWKWFGECESQIAGSSDPADEYEVFSIITGFDYELKW